MNPQKASTFYKVMQLISEYFLELNGYSFNVATTGPNEDWKHFISRILPKTWSDVVFVTGLIQPNQKYMYVVGDTVKVVSSIYDAHMRYDDVDIYFYEIND